MCSSDLASGQPLAGHRAQAGRSGGAVVTAHTPEPWEYHSKLSASENHKGYNVWFTEANHGLFIADVSPIDTDGVRGEANADLIAAAPTAPHECDNIGCPGNSVLRVLRLALKQHEETDFLGGLGDWLTDFMADKAEVQS